MLAAADQAERLAVAGPRRYRIAMMSLSLLLAMAQPEMPVPVPSFAVPRPMTVEVERDPVTDRVSAYAVARAQNGRLWIGCDPDRYRGLRVYVRGEGWVDSDIIQGGRWVTHRFDGAEPRRLNWDTRRGAAYLRWGAEAGSFLDWMRASKRLVIRTRDVEKREMDLIFPLAGAQPALDEMLRACSPA